MINKAELTAEWINRVSKESRNADKILVEKVIRAMLLIEGLLKEEIEFVLKGGTSLIFLLKSAKRLSIDVDINIHHKLPVINDKFTEIVNEQGFTRFERQERSTNTKIEKSHYKFFYKPLHKSNTEEEYILLDILYEQINYINIKSIPLASTFTPNSGRPLKVKIPSTEDILGDKLTAFAPRTTGIPYQKGEVSMSMEIIKQLYDIGSLFDEVKDLSIIKSTFSKFVITEVDYIGKTTLTENDVLNDIYETSLSISTRGSFGKESFEKLQTGIQRIRNFIFSESYQIEKAIVDSSKAAYLATLIKYKSGNIEKYTEGSVKKEWIVNEPLNTKLNILKRSNIEAFFYWYKVYELTIAGKGI
ncbi:MAG: nucleotidyl transferase AbiEii/AbiGii toxin family protein [Ignavibacteria bacterium]